MTDIKKLAETLHPLERAVLPVLVKYSTFEDLVTNSKLKDVEVMRALQWLENKNAIELKEEIKEFVVLDKNGKEYVKIGLPERRFMEGIKNGKWVVISKLVDSKVLLKDEVNICIGALKKKAAIEIKKDNGQLMVKLGPAAKQFLEKDTLEEKFLKSNFPIEFSKLTDEQKFAFDSLKRRKNIIRSDVSKLKTAFLTDVGKKLSKVKLDSKTIDRLTLGMLKTGDWKGKTFRRYDVGINVPRINGGKRHFVKQTIEYIKRIWLELGFKEMTGEMVGTALWDMDALFVPQDHPARQMQDSFYLKDLKANSIAMGKLDPIYKKIKAVHENGGDTGSTGWGGKWSEDVAKEVMLRTHTTILSAKTIAALKDSDLPAKFFSVGRVFRNEALDWKHLFEFYQVEGIVIDENANFKHLIGYLKNFYLKMGYKDVRLRPAHFPYTEPSVEVDVLHPVKNEWIELGGAGIFRPEVVIPLLGRDVPVLAWGNGMGRIISSYFNIKDIRELYKNDLDQLRKIKTWLK